MPTLYAFERRETAVKLTKIAGQPARYPESEESDDIIGWVLLTPTAGIAAMTNSQNADNDTEVPSALCDAYALVEIDGVVKRRKALDPDGNHWKIRAANMSDEAIDGGKFIRANRVVGGALLVDYAPCS